MNVLGIKARIRESIRRKTSRVHPRPLLFFGHQKSGTTAISSLVGKISSVDVMIDPLFRIPDHIAEKRALFYGETDIFDVMRRNPYYFSYPIIKDPNFSFFPQQLLDAFPESYAVFIVRDPRDNIRSILNRLGLPGDLSDLETDHLNYIPESWGMSITGKMPPMPGDSYIEILAHRWKITARNYLDYKNKFHLVKYEEFIQAKASCIQDIATRAGLEVCIDISSDVDRQYQSRGNKNVDKERFFGCDNLSRINDICEDEIKELGYLY